MQKNSWHFSTLHNSPCKVIETQNLWGQEVCRIWLPHQDAVVLTSKADLRTFEDALEPEREAEYIAYVGAAAKVAQVLEGRQEYADVMLAPMESTVIPLPHQLQALSRVVSNDKVRYLLADEVGLGKTIEAGLIFRELKLRGLVRRVLIVAPTGLVTQWQMEMRNHFSETFFPLYPGAFAPYHYCYPEQNVWSLHQQMICPLDSVKPLDSRRGWSREQVDDYNRWRYFDLITAGWDMVIIDEAHRLAGSTDLIARYKLGQGLAEASPYVLLLSATPHQGKSDGFQRLMNILDPATFPDAESITRERVAPFVIRTEKRKAIDDKGDPLFKPRHTRLLGIAWEERHRPQQELYEAVTEYVRNGYNQALLENKRHLGFLMLLLQRLVVSSTRAIRATLERRLEVIRANIAADLEPQAEGSATQANEFGFEFLQSLGKEDLDTLYDMDGQSMLDGLLSLRRESLRDEEEKVSALLKQARQCEQSGQDAKVEALFAMLYQLQAEEGEADLKCLIFTEFTATQDMLREFLEARGISVVTLNGSMGQEERIKAQEAFRSTTRVLVSTDAGGEGLNLQFCHVVINYDLPWNPMRIEQRIGRVDRIGQTKPVRAINLTLEESVDFHVREVLERKLAVILGEMGIDKTSDVLDSTQAGEIFENAFTSAFLHPEKIEQTVDYTTEILRHEILELREPAAVYGISSEPDIQAVERLRSHPLPHWVERMTVGYVRSQGGAAVRKLTGWDITWPDGQKQNSCTFTVRESRVAANSVHLTLENSRIRGLALHIPRLTPGQPVPCVAMPSLPGNVSGLWGLFEVRLQRIAGQTGIPSSLVQVPQLRRGYVSVFVSNGGKLFIPTARHIWDALQNTQCAITDVLGQEASQQAHADALAAAEQVGQFLFDDLQQEHLDSVARERERGHSAFSARRKSIERVGLPEVRRHRMAECDADERVWRDELAAAQKVVPEIRTLLLMRIAGEQEGAGG
ncbi:DEAD/DEAH box helicase family protein [Desulfovibrio sp. OttesenSCG-928-G11]|nr:DEAD/DEAH box helicase family protein [Desulfovibrio sp. OttesenSCG-928-G11]